MEFNNLYGSGYAYPALGESSGSSFTAYYYASENGTTASQGPSQFFPAPPNTIVSPDYLSPWPTAVPFRGALVETQTLPSTSSGQPEAYRPQAAEQFVPTALTSGYSAVAADLPPPIPSPSSPYDTHLPSPPSALYSSTGFDMLTVLGKVVTRPNPQVVLGPVDLTCSFVVVDVRKYDLPIIYASPTFSALTGYENNEIIGRNCRFLQSPTGHVQAGERRNHTDELAVAHIKARLMQGNECQASLTNYRKGGSPFINLTSIIPIRYTVKNVQGEDEEVYYCVGFQVDLENQPAAILQTMRDGTYIVDYGTGRRDGPSKGIHRGISDELKQIIKKPDDSAIRSEDQDRDDLNTLLLEHADDFVHVLSLKGAFLYASPSVERLLEYTQSDLIGKSVDQIAHPSDVVAVARELKDSSIMSGPLMQTKHVNILFRVKRKVSGGYVWLESSGRVLPERGKGRKVIIMSGRIHPQMTPTISWGDIELTGGVMGKDFWCRVSLHAGLFITVSTAVSDILGWQSENLVGKRFLDLVDVDSRAVVQEAMNATAYLPGADSHGSSQRELRRVSCYMSGNGGNNVAVIVCFYPVDPLSPSSVSYSPGENLREAEPSFVLCQVRHNAADAPANPAGVATFQNIDRDVFGMGSSLPPLSARSGDVAFHSAANLASLAQHQQLQQMGQRQPITHPLSSSVFEELNSNRNTSWQFELEQTRIMNRKLRMELDSLNAASHNVSGVEEPSAVGSTSET